MSTKNKHKNKTILMNNTIPNNNSNTNITNNNLPIQQQVQQSKLVHLDIQMPPNTILVNIYEYDTLQKENIELKTKISEYTKHKSDLMDIITQKDRTIDELKKENETLKMILDELKEQNGELKEKNKELIQKIDYLINKDKIFEALSKLNDCDKLSNNSFKNEYRKYFKLKKYDNVPNLGEFIDNPPEELDDKNEYDFWKLFCQKYPNSDNKDFRLIYKRISNERVQSGAHYNIYDIGEEEFDNLMKIALSDIYNNNKKICDDYKKWLYLF